MVPTTNLSIFIEKNDMEFRNMVYDLCYRLSYPGIPEDIIQDMYLKFINQKTLETYNIEGDVKISTYLYSIIKNFVLSKNKSHECRYYKQLYMPTSKNDPNEMDEILSFNEPNDDYKSVIRHNESSDTVNGMMSGIDSFERNFSKSIHNKRFLFRRRKHQNKSQMFLRLLNKLKSNGRIGEEFDVIKDIIDNIGSTGCTLIDLLHLIYKGYTNRQISKIYGVSEVTISTMKHRLSKVMKDFGFF